MGTIIPLTEQPFAATAAIALTRREFLRGSGVLIGVIAAGNALSLVAPSRVWAVELQTLTSEEAAALVKMGRVLYPHRKLSDAVYALVVKDLDADAAADKAKAELLKDGVRSLDQAAGGFAKAVASRQFAAVKSLQGQPFFEAVRGKCITSLYDNAMAYASFGYEGASWDKGGYVKRGFQDLKWLPDPPADASPKSFYA